MTNTPATTSRLRRLKERIDTRMNDRLREMKEGYDDSVVGFNDAWDLVRAAFDEELHYGP